MPIDYCVEGSKEKDLQKVWEDGSNKALKTTASGTLHVSALLSRELALKTFGNKNMDSGDTAIRQEATSRSGETVPSRWRKEPSVVSKMSTFGSHEGERHPHVDPKHIGNTASAQVVNSGKLVSSGEVTHQTPEKQYAHHRPSCYSYRHSHSFPQHALQQRFVHSTKPHQSLEGYIWQYPGHLQSVVSEDLFSFHMHGHSRGFSRKKISSISPAYSQYAQKSIEQTEDTHRKEQKPKKPGKYICPYCTRACAKPSVLKKHIRSHTGERPYPCVPCGFSFKTKSNLYKHRKSHAHAIKAGLVPFTESAVSKLDLDAACIEVEIHSDGEQSTDTDEETLLLVEGTGKLSPIPPLPPIPLDISSKSGDGLDPSFHLSSEEALGGTMKVPILIIPKSGTRLPTEVSQFMGPDMLQTPSLSKGDESHTVKQKLALRLSEKKGQDSEQSLNLLSPHSKGSTDSGYFSRSESAEQQINPPNTNAKSYEEIIFGKYCRLSPRTALTVATAAANQEANLLDRRGKVESLPLANTGLEIKILEDPISQLIANREGIIDPSRLNTIKSSKFSSGSNTESRVNVMGSTKNETKVYPLAHQGNNIPVLLEAPVDTSPLTRSNSMPTSSATNLSIPPALRGSHSFDERMTGSDDVFYPGTGGISHQRMLRRQAAFELPSLHEGHSDSDPYGRTAKSTVALSNRSTIAEKGPPLMDKKTSTGEKTVPDYDTGKHYRRWDEFEMQKLNYRDAQGGGGLKHGGEYLIDVTVSSQGVQSRYGTMFENRKRRKEKSVGDEEDAPLLCSSAVGSSVGSLMSSDYDHKSQIQEATRSGFGVLGHDYPVYGQQERFETCRSHPRSGTPTAVSEESLSTDQDKSIDPINRKPPGNVISVIQHTNSLSRPNSFERSESTEHVTSQQDKSYSSETCDSEITESPMSPDWTQQMENTEVVSKPSPSQQQQPYHMQPRLVRQHNIQVPEIRVTEEPDKPEKEQEHTTKEHEKTPEEFQWPQRSETLSQLPAEKLPPKKKRLRLADIEHSSGESSFESTGTSLSRSPSQESNLSHSSSFSMSFEREDIIKAITLKQDEFGKQSEFLTVPPGSYSLSIPGHHHQKEMRRSSSEQMPCPHPTEMPEIRSKSFDYGNLSHASGATFTTLSPTRERKKCFLVRQASFSGSPETSQADQGLEQNIKQEQVEQIHSSRRSAQVAWHHSSSSSSSSSLLQSSLSEDCGQKAVVSSSSSYHSQPSIHMASQETIRNTLAQASYVPSRHTIEQHAITHQEKVLFPPVHSALFQLPYPAVSVPHLPVQHPVLWQSCAEPLPRHFQHHLHQLQDPYIKQPLVHPIQAEVLPSYHLELAQEKVGKKLGDYTHSKEHTYQRYSETPLQLSKNVSAKLQPEGSVVSSDNASDQQLQTAVVSQNVRSLQSLPGAVVPVRIQTHVPSYGSVMYTSISQILVTHAQTSSPAIVICRVSENTSQRTSATNAAMRGIGFNIAQMLGQHGGLEQYPLWKVPQTLPLGLDSAVPLCLPSSSDTASPLGGGKRMLSPASSLELFMETKQQKRVKEEKMYGQIVEELSAVELTNSDIKKELSRSPKPQLVRQCRTTEPKDSASSLPSSSLSSSLSSSSQNIPLSTTESTPLGFGKHYSSRAAFSEQKFSETSEDRMSPDELEDDGDDAASDMSLSPQRSSATPSEIHQEGPLKQHKRTRSMLVQLASSPGGISVGSTILLTDAIDFQQILQFPSLRTTTTVSWCFLNYTKPSHARQDTLKSSVYSSWCISPCNPNPSGLNTKTTLALLRSKQKNTIEIYAMATLHRPGGGKVTSSSAWKQQFAQMKSEPSHIFCSKLEKKIAGNMIKERAKGESHGEKEVTSKHTEPIRIKIFEGGLKSNEDYVYVRGRGRGKYICEECGIRCKKPSMLKKHIRTHTDVRPYVCKLCNFAFKTKGNLTKHMKSKAHMKKCLELGVAMTSVDDTESEEAENIEDLHKEEKSSMTGLSTDHQFSDAEESDAEDADDNEDEDDDDDDFDEHQGDLTPKTRSRSTSPQPPRFSSLSVTAALSQKASPESSDSVGHSSLISYLATLPSIQVTPLVTPSDSCGDARMLEYQRLFYSRHTDSEHDKDRLDMPSCMDEDYMLSSEPSSSPHEFSSSSQQSSPGYDSSPCRDNSPKRYLMPRGDLSPRRHLSPRRDISPMRHLSPRKEAALRRELSPRRDVSPRRHLSPLRPVSPGKDLSARRDPSPRQERRYMAAIRAVSPRRASYHSPSFPMVHYLQSESLSLGHTSLRKGLSQVPYFSLYGEKDAAPEYQGSNHLLEGHKDYVFSHLPLHSQQQVRAPVPMIPIGGIQMVHSIPASLPGLGPQPAVPLQSKSTEEKRSMISEALRDCSTISKHHQKHTSSHVASRDSSSGTSSSLLLSMRQSTSEDSSQPIEREQEENIQTCTKAIASLKIVAEEAASLGTDQLSRALETQPKPLESAQLSIRHFSGSETGQLSACALATQPDLHGEKDNFGTSQAALTHSAFYRYGGKDPHASTQEGIDPAVEKRH